MGLISLIAPVSHRVNRQILHTRQLEKLASKVAGHDFEFIFVGDNSNKNCLSVLKELSDSDKRYRIINLTRNFGSKASFLAGISYASGDCVAYLPGKNLDPCQVLEELIRNWEAGAKIVFSKWTNMSDSAFNRQRSINLESYLRRKLFSNRIYFQDISSFLIDKEVYYLLSQITDPFSDIMETLAWTGFQFHMVEYSYQIRADGLRSLDFNKQTLSQDISPGIYWPRTFKTSLSIGLFLCMLGGLTSLGLVITSDYYQIFIPRLWLLGGFATFMVGLQLMLMGIFGEHLYKSLEKIRDRPVFVVESIVNPPLSSEKISGEKIEKMILSLWSVRKQKSAYASTQNDIYFDQESG